MTACERLLIFTRFPRAGEAKTRLIPALGPEGAAAVQRELTARTLAFARLAATRRGIDVEVRTTGAAPDEFAPLFGVDLQYRDQGQGELGARLERAFEDAFSEGAQRVAVIGCDCPGATDARLCEAFARLERGAVLGPAEDGGYWLLGLRAPAPGLFHGVTWGSAQVAAETRARAARAGLALAELETLADVDRPEDLERWRPT